MSDPLQDTLFREIDDDLRHDQYLEWWKRYGNHVIAAALALVLAVAGHQAWKAWDINSRSAQAESFMAAVDLAKGGKRDEALAAFGRLAADAGAGYATLARFHEAAILAERGDRVGASTAYRELAAGADTAPLFKDLAVLLGVLNDMDAGGNEADLTARLSALDVEGVPWRHGARELLAVLSLRAGDEAKARDILTRLGADAAAPQGVRERASEMLAVIGR